MTTKPRLVPEWIEGQKINEVLFCEEFLQQYPMVSVGGTFFTVEGLVSDFLKQNERAYNLEYINKITISGGRQTRGFLGIELLQRPFL